MTANELISIMAYFLTKDFASDKAEALFGSVLDDSTPETVLLQPKAAFLERVLLHFVKVGEVNFLGMISLVWKQLAPIDFGVLARTYGEPHELPRLQPTGPKRYSFAVKGKDYAGQLLVGVVSGTGDIREIRDVQFRRNPPGW